MKVSEYKPNINDPRIYIVYNYTGTKVWYISKYYSYIDRIVSVGTLHNAMLFTEQQALTICYKCPDYDCRYIQDYIDNQAGI